MSLASLGTQQAYILCFRQLRSQLVRASRLYVPSGSTDLILLQNIASTVRLVTACGVYSLSCLKNVGSRTENKR